MTKRHEVNTFLGPDEDGEIVVCVDAESQRFVPLDQWIRMHIDTVVEFVDKVLDENKVPAHSPFRAEQITKAAALVDATMRQSVMLQVEARGETQH